MRDLGTDYDTSGADFGQRVLDELVAILDLEKIEEDIFRGRSPKVSLQRVFGGQVAGQALVAAGRTVSPDRQVHSLHSYFIRPGDPAVPIVYEVDRVRDGRSFSTRRVVAIQHGKTIFSLSASFQLPQEGITHQSVAPAGSSPESLPRRVNGLGDHPQVHEQIPWPFDVRYVDKPSWERRSEGPRDGDYRIWMKAAGVMSDDPLLHACALTFASDLTLLDAVLVRHAVAYSDEEIRTASLDHAVWFHRPFRADTWLLYAQESPSASGGRGLAMDRIFDQQGNHVATVVQEGMIRARRRG